MRVLVEPTPGRVLQWTLLDRAQPAPEQVSTLVARLTALMGEGHVGAPAVVDTWRPGAYTMQEFRVKSFEFRADERAVLNSELAPLNSALKRFRLPIPARVQVREGRPVRVVTDRHGFSSGAILQAAGPWRTSGEWWTSQSASSAAQTGTRASGASWESDPSAPSGESLRSWDSGLRPSRESPSASWDRDEWDVALADGTIYRLFVEREVGQWFIDAILD